MDDSINISVGSLSEESSSSVAATYKKAAKLFLNKRFDTSYETIQPLLLQQNVALQDRIWVKIWSLYMAILDKAVEDRNSIFPRKTRKELSNKASTGQIWTEVNQASDGGLVNISPDLMLSLVTLSVRHCKSNLREVMANLEQYLSAWMDAMGNQNLTETDAKAYQSLVNAYAMKVLPAMKEFEYAKEFIHMNPFVTNKLQAEEELSSIKVRMEKESKEAEKENARRMMLEKERVAQAEKASATAFQAQSSSTSSPPISTSSSSIASAKSSPSSSSPSSPASNNHNQHLQDVAPNPIRSPPPTSELGRSNGGIRPHSFGSLIAYWRSYFSELFKSASFLKLLLFFTVIVLSVTNPLAKRRLKQILASLWAKLVQTVRMGTKVSYV